jgi:hypothetical protein
VRLRTHVLAALQGIASERWHGRGCHRRNCGSACLCAPCHARVALEKMRLVRVLAARDDGGDEPREHQLNEDAARRSAGEEDADTCSA